MKKNIICLLSLIVCGCLFAINASAAIVVVDQEAGLAALAKAPNPNAAVFGTSQSATTDGKVTPPFDLATDLGKVKGLEYTYYIPKNSPNASKLKQGGNCHHGTTDVCANITFLTQTGWYKIEFIGDSEKLANLKTKLEASDNQQDALLENL